TSTLFMVSGSTSATAATRCLTNPRLQLLLDQVAGLLHRDAVDDLAEEALDHHPLGDPSRDAARLQIKEVLRVDGRDGRSVRAADVVVEDLEHRDRVGVGLLREQQVAV